MIFTANDSSSPFFLACTTCAAIPLTLALARPLTLTLTTNPNPYQVRLLRSRGANAALCNREGQDMAALALSVRPADTTLLEELKAHIVP